MKLPTPTRSALGGLSLALLLAGCAQQMIRDETTAQLRSGNFEAALQGLKEGVAKYPESATLRAGLTSAQADAMARLAATAAHQRSAGQFDDADLTIKRALALDPANDRLLNMQTDLATERRIKKNLDEAHALAAAGRKEQALRRVESALRESPRMPALQAIQRRLEAELHLEAGAGSRRALAETRPISLDFRNAPLFTVLEAITRGSGVNFILDRDVRQDSRVTLYLRSAQVDDAIDLVTGAQQLARRIVDPQTVLIYPNTPEKQREHQEQVIRVFHLASAEARTTAALLRSMLRIKDPFVDERANLVALRETPEIIALAERLVALHDVGEAEVMLEVEILEITSSRLTELGINFPNSFALTPLAPAGATGLTVSNLQGINSSRIGVNVAGLLVNLRREAGDVNILANPRIRARNREKARILIGDKVPVITSTSSSTGFVAESVSYLDVGLKLDVEPVVSPDDEVTMKLGLEVSSLAKEVRTGSGSLAYQIGTRNANTVLRLRDGETQLLGGLISNEDRSIANRVPGLGDLPVAGRLFSSQKDDAVRTELVLAITPRILRNAARPDIAQAQLWVGPEQSTRLREAPGRTPAAANVAAPGGTAPSGIQTIAAATPANAVADRFATTGDSGGGPVRAAWQAPADAKSGEAFTVTLNLQSSTPLRGAPLEIAYPAEVLEVLEVSEGPFFRQSDATTSFTQAVNTGTGRINAGILRNDSVGATGQGGVLTLRLRAKTAGPVSLSLTSFKPIGVGQTATLADLPVLRVDVK